MKYPFIALLCFLSLSGSSQAHKSLLETVTPAQTDSGIIAAYQQFIERYQYTQADSALLYANEGLALAKKNGYAIGEGRMLNSMGQVHERHGLLEPAESRYEEALAIFEAVGYRRGVAATLNGLGVIAGKTGKYDEATRYFLRALKEYQGLEDPQGVVQSYIKLGVVSDLLGDLDKALEYYLKAEELNAGLPSSNATLTLLNNIGIVYGKRNDIATASKYFRQGLRQCDPIKSTGLYITLLGSLGIAHEKSGKLDSALFVQEQVLALARENKLPEEEARALVNVASLYSERDPEKSLGFLNDALAIARRITQLNLMTEIYEAMIEIYKEKKNFHEALALTEERQILKDSLFSLQKSKEIANLHAHQELARQEGEIRNLAVLNEKSMLQRNIMIVIALVCVALIGIVWFFNTRISNLNSELVQKQKELKNSNSVKDKLFSIIGHDLRAPLTRVIGLLNVLSIRQEGSDESVIIDKLRQQSETTLDTLDNLLLWGQRQLKGIRLNQQTFNLKDQVRRSLLLSHDYATQKNVKLADTIPQELWVHADPSHFDFIIRNLISNAVKFSHAGSAVVINAVTEGNHQVILSVKDTGIGMTKELQQDLFKAGNESIRGTWNEKGTGIGLMLCREYVVENGGKLWMESEPGKGSTFFISFMKKEPVSKPEYAEASM